MTDIDIDVLRAEIEAGIAEVLGQSQAISVLPPVGECATMPAAGGSVGAQVPVEPPASRSSVVEVSWAELPIAEPAPIKPSTTCTHGYTNPASCIECMADGPVGPITSDPRQLLKATRFQVARYSTRCDRPTCSAEIEPGEPIGYVEGSGWCCRACTVHQ